MTRMRSSVAILALAWLLTLLPHQTYASTLGQPRRAITIMPPLRPSFVLPRHDPTRHNVKRASLQAMPPPSGRTIMYPSRLWVLRSCALSTWRAAPSRRRSRNKPAARPTTFASNRRRRRRRRRRSRSHHDHNHNHNHNLRLSRTSQIMTMTFATVHIP